ncbi:MAG: ATP-binding protein [Chromatiaceae bacterium]|nr:ATP-binding protein [Gammaproteobacteria bacterium]MCB1861642.1 ATP-binding protein [Gammaproteobacteria bacterium]MCB1905323.1 ATP-binding protein [Gammaproteobacteria bacterium]MCP5427778.1 ATP-binding protein [Chromatiaceae bacterium]MCP5445951.1 ATP-binding protein [Chromatiaceae bacterium]
MANAEKLLKRAGLLLTRMERLLAPAAAATDWNHIAFRWRRGQGLQPVAHPHLIPLESLLCMEPQKQEIVRNTRQFVVGRSANNVLLWGSRGTGKSSLIKAVLHGFADRGLRLVEVEKADLIDLPDIVDRFYGRPERFILFCDDLSFEADDASYKSLKAVLDGSIAAPPENVLIYATSNRRHLLPESMRENQETRMVEGEIHPSEGVEEKISLSERFGLWLSFYPFNQEEYLRIVDHWLATLGARTTTDEATRAAALQWALKRGSRSGRVALQFARDWAGR